MLVLERVCIKIFKKTLKSPNIALVLDVFNKKRLERYSESRSWVAFKPIVKIVLFQRQWETIERGSKLVN